MRLKNPGTIDAALAAVSQVKGQLTNTMAGSGTQRLVDFTRWCERWAIPQLGNHFQGSEELFSLLGETHYRLVSAAPHMAELQLNSFLSREWHTWDARLGHLAGELERDREFIKRPGRIVVVETSALMEGVFFTEFDWHVLDSSLAADPVRLVVPILVIEELDGLKLTKDKQQKADAKQVLRELWSLHGTAPPKPASLPGARTSPSRSTSTATGTGGARTTTARSSSRP